MVMPSTYTSSSPQEELKSKKSSQNPDFFCSGTLKQIKHVVLRYAARKKEAAPFHICKCEPPIITICQQWYKWAKVNNVVWLKADWHLIQTQHNDDAARKDGSKFYIMFKKNQVRK